MAIQPFPFSGNGRDGSSSAQKLALDNLIRRELKVGDPNDAQQVARALLDRYQADPRARGLTQEAAGLPFLQTAIAAPPLVATATATSVDLEQAVNDVNQDLDHLVHSNLLKDVQPELAGWAQAIRAAMAEGVQAARCGLDTRQRDKAFSIRRQLSDYARMARLVGALTPAVNYDYRNLGQSLDEVSAVLLVLMGESLANTGLAGGRFLLQAPYSELQVRRDAAIYALRNLVGATQEAYGPDQWPRGLDAYRRLYDALELQGQGDLRALLVEAELARAMDELIQRAGQGSAEGLRALGSTAQIDLQRFSRLVAIGNRLVEPESPPLTSFLEALSLFVNAFQPAGGFRLLRVARPAILFYGLYGVGEETLSDQRLAQLVMRRGVLASQLDCLMRCECSSQTVQAQIVLDKLLYQIDRAIDLYAVGDQDLGPPEGRAAAYSYVIDAIQLIRDGNHVPTPDAGLIGLFDEVPDEVFDSLDVLQVLLRPLDGGAEKLFWGKDMDKEFERLCKPGVQLPDTTLALPDLMMQELCVQHDVDTRWRSLVDGMAPGCVPNSAIFGAKGSLTMVTQYAINLIKYMPKVTAEDLDRPIDVCSLQPDIPAHFETSLEGLVFNTDRVGNGRGKLLPKG